MSEWFSFERRKTKSKVITLANHSRCKHRIRTNQNSKQIHVTGVKRGKTRANEAQFVLLFASHWLTSGPNFASRPMTQHSVITQNQTKRETTFDIQ